MDAASNTAAATATVTVNPAPAAPTAGSNSPVNSGSTLSLSSNTIAGATYNWVGPNGFTSSLEDPTISSVTTAAAGCYSVTATVNGCTSPTATTCVTVSPTGVQEINLQSAITIYPNPTSGLFQITSNALRITTIEIYNVFGEEIYQSSVIGHISSVIDVSSHPSGVYFLQVKTGEGTAVRKIVIQK